MRKQANVECLSWRYDQSGVVATLHLGEVTFKKNELILACYVVEGAAKKEPENSTRQVDWDPWTGTPDFK